MNKKYWIVIVSAIGIIALITWLFFGSRTIMNTTASGIYFGNIIWNGTITITGDTTIVGNLTVEPGTTVRFVVGDDWGGGNEVPADGYNDNDPTRLLEYGKTHAGLVVLRRLFAIGTTEQPITFTSAAANPTYADWESVIFLGDGSIVDNVIVEYSRNGLNPITTQKNSVIQNSTIRHTLWGAVSSSNSSIQVLGNHIYDCGHEGVDVQQGEQIIRGNLIEDCHAGIVILKGDAVVENNIMRDVSDGIGIDPKANPTVRNNTVTLADENIVRKYTYQNFSYNRFGDPN